MKQRTTWFCVGVLLISYQLALTGCASSSSAVSGQQKIPRTIQIPKATGEAAQFVDEFKAPFIERGFIFGESDDPMAASMLIEFDPSVMNTEFKVSLVQQGTTLLNATATNKGWGTGIARSQALTKLAAEVRTGIQKSLVGMAIQITPDRSLAKAACDGMFDRSELKKIARKVVLTGDQPADFGQLIDKTFATDEELPALIFWAKVQKECFDKKVEQTITSGQSAKSDDLIATFNWQQALLADLVNRGITYGEFGKRSNEILTTSAQARAKRVQDATAALEREKDRGATQTNATQQGAQQNLNTYKPTYTQCNRIGTQVFCNTF